MVEGPESGVSELLRVTRGHDSASSVRLFVRTL